MVNLVERLVLTVFILIFMVEIVDACPCGLKLSEEEAYFIVRITGECPCGSELSLEEAYLKADGVFIGKVVESRSAEFKIYDQVYEYIDYVFDIIKKYKGNVINNKVIFRTGFGGSGCGYRFSLENEYLIYGFLYKENLYSTNICARNCEIEFCEERELNLLEELIEK